MWVTDKFEKLGTREIDLTAYAKKSEIPTKVSQLANDSGFLTAVPEEYVTDSELSQKGYETTQSVDGKLQSYVKTSDLRQLQQERLIHCSRNKEVKTKEIFIIRRIKIFLQQIYIR